MRQIHLRRGALYAAAMAIGIAGGVGAVITLERRPSVTVQRVEIDQPAVQPGGMLVVRYAFTRTRDCDVETVRFLWRWQRARDGWEREILPLAGNSAGMLGPGSYRVALMLPVPAEVLPGDWMFRSRTEEKCGVLHPMAVHETPDIQVHVEEKS